MTDEVRNEKLKLFDIPENCSGLDKVKVNQSIWDKLKPQTRSMDVKMQTLQTMLVSAAAGMIHVVDDMLQMQNVAVGSHSSIDKMTREMLNATILVGQCNVELNHRRRELIRPDLNTEYHYLCASAVPYTNWLFGDELKDQVKEISETNKVCGKIFSRPRGRGMYNVRGRRGRYTRFQPYHAGFARGYNPQSQASGYRYARKPGTGRGFLDQAQVASQQRKPPRKD